MPYGLSPEASQAGDDFQLWLNGTLQMPEQVIIPRPQPEDILATAQLMESIGARLEVFAASFEQNSPAVVNGLEVTRMAQGYMVSTPKEFVAEPAGIGSGLAVFLHLENPQNDLTQALGVNQSRNVLMFGRITDPDIQSAYTSASPNESIDAATVLSANLEGEIGKATSYPYSLQINEDHTLIGSDVLNTAMRVLPVADDIRIANSAMQQILDSLSR
jgi:hypothetical protein